MPGLPSKRFSELIRTDSNVRGLKLIKKALESIGAILKSFFVLRRYLIYSLLILSMSNIRVVGCGIPFGKRS